MFEKAVARGRYVEIGLKFLVDVDEAGRHADAGPDRKAQSMRLAGAVIRILPQDHDADALDRRQVRSEEHTSELQSLMRISYAVFCLKKQNEYDLSCISSAAPHPY